MSANALGGGRWELPGVRRGGIPCQAHSPLRKWQAPGDGRRIVVGDGLAGGPGRPSLECTRHERAGSAAPWSFRGGRSTMRSSDGTPVAASGAPSVRSAPPLPHVSALGATPPLSAPALPVTPSDRSSTPAVRYRGLSSPRRCPAPRLDSLRQRPAPPRQRHPGGRVAPAPPIQIAPPAGARRERDQGIRRRRPRRRRRRPSIGATTQTRRVASIAEEPVVSTLTGGEVVGACAHMRNIAMIAPGEVVVVVVVAEVGLIMRDAKTARPSTEPTTTPPNTAMRSASSVPLP